MILDFANGDSRAKAHKQFSSGTKSRAEHSDLWLWRRRVACLCECGESFAMALRFHVLIRGNERAPCGRRRTGCAQAAAD